MKSIFVFGIAAICWAASMGAAASIGFQSGHARGCLEGFLRGRQAARTEPISLILKLRYTDGTNSIVRELPVNLPGGLVSASMPLPQK